MSSNAAIALSSRYTQIQLGLLNSNHYPQLEIISEEPLPDGYNITNNPSAIPRYDSLEELPATIRRRESVAITPACDCNNCCCYCCCGCRSFYTTRELEYYSKKFTCWPMTSWAINLCLEGMDDDGEKLDCCECNKPGQPPCADCMCLLSPLTIVLDTVALCPRFIKYLIQTTIKS